MLTGIGNFEITFYLDLALLNMSFLLISQIAGRNFSKNMVKVHYIGYPSSMDEWRNCSREEEKIMKLIKERFIPSEDTLEEKLEVFRDKFIQG